MDGAPPAASAAPATGVAVVTSTEGDFIGCDSEGSGMSTAR
jgi:hypothetical protein